MSDKEKISALMRIIIRLAVMVGNASLECLNEAKRILEA